MSSPTLARRAPIRCVTATNSKCCVTTWRGWYRARIRTSSDSALIGRVGWVERWLVDDTGVPPMPTVTRVPPTVAPTRRPTRVPTRVPTQTPTAVFRPVPPVPDPGMAATSVGLRQRHSPGGLTVDR
ncbi:MAG: hypothetical protein WCP31_10060 [Chloroflexales bacterium]